MLEYWSVGYAFLQYSIALSPQASWSVSCSCTPIPESSPQRHPPSPRLPALLHGIKWRGRRRSQRLYASFARSGDTDRARKTQPLGPFHTTLCFLIVDGQSLRSFDYLLRQRFLFIGRYPPASPERLAMAGRSPAQ